MADWARVQGISSNSVTPSGISFSSPVTVGSIVNVGVLLSTGATVSGVTDDKNNTYPIVNSHDDGTLYVAGFRSNGPITNGPTTIIATVVGNSSSTWQVQDEFSQPTGALSEATDGQQITPATTGNTSSPNYSTAGKDVLVWGVAFSTGPCTPGVDFEAGTGSGTPICSEWKVLANPSASVAADFATQPGTAWIVTFGTVPTFAPPPAPTTPPLIAKIQSVVAGVPMPTLIDALTLFQVTKGTVTNVNGTVMIGNRPLTNDQYFQLGEILGVTG